MKLPSIRCDQRGASAVEFAMVAPVLFSIIIGAAQMGVLFFANTGLQHAVGEGARVAMIFPRPSDATIKQSVKNAKYGVDPNYLVGEPLITYQLDGGVCAAEITWSYNVPLNFIFYETPPVILEHERRVFLQDGATGPVTCDAAATPVGGGGGSGSGGGSGGGTSSSGNGKGSDKVKNK